MATHEFKCPQCGDHHGGIISNTPPPPTSKTCRKCLEAGRWVLEVTKDDD